MFYNSAQIRSFLNCLKHVEPKFPISYIFPLCTKYYFDQFCGGSLGSITRPFLTSLPRNKEEKRDKRSLTATGPLKHDGTEGERSVNMDAIIQR